MLGEFYFLFRLHEKTDDGFVMVNAIGANLVDGFSFADDVNKNLRFVRLGVTERAVDVFSALHSR